MATDKERFARIFDMIQFARIGELNRDWSTARDLYAKLGRETLAREISLRGLARVHLAQSDFSKALECQHRIAQFRRNRPVHLVLKDNYLRMTCSVAKLKHDLEQVEYLIEQGVFRPSERKKYAGYRELMEMANELGSSQFQVDEKILRILGRQFYSLDQIYSPPSLDGAALTRQDGARLEKKYTRDRGVLVIDDFLTKAALRELRKAVLESTYWFDTKKGGYLGAYAQDGLASGLLYQIAAELKRRLPNVLGKHLLWEQWAYKYDQDMRGIKLHGDSAAVNVNFWITPEEANEDPESGGLIVYPVEPPAKWASFSQYSGDTRPGIVQKYLDRKRENAVKIPYRENRVVIFNSQYFHKTDSFRFRPGYANRRVNMTFLYGSPPNDPLFWHKTYWARDRISTP